MTAEDIQYWRRCQEKGKGTRFTPSFFETTGTLDAQLIHGDERAAIFGLATANDPDLLQLDGSFAATHDPRF
ncbi:hypothetical protein [Cereibacter sphaeroides]|uniref:hypothetical protein n=1 Tax=Cereibacter sphaeroides TaxID=1063 RepID=UPI003FCD332E